ncbi:MAG: hypothetical protein ACREU4_13855, partial [Burkholderiales bacterium]
MRSRAPVIPFVLSLVAAAPGAAAQGASGRPIGAYDVVPELPGMGRAVDTAATAARRRALLR